MGSFTVDFAPASTKPPADFVRRRNDLRMAGNHRRVDERQPPTAVMPLSCQENFLGTWSQAATTAWSIVPKIE